jgi:hypothetical protein
LARTACRSSLAAFLLYFARAVKRRLTGFFFAFFSTAAFCLRRERSKFPTSYTKSRQSSVRVLFHAPRNPAKVCCGHVAIPIRQRQYTYLTIIGWHVFIARGRITGNLEGCFRIAGDPGSTLKARLFISPILRR